MVIAGIIKFISRLLVGLILIANAQAANNDLASAPLTTSSTSSVLPNLLFILDDSGSMDSDYLPDWADSSDPTLFKNASFNGVYYNPAITYTPPTSYNTNGTVNTTKYPSQTSWISVKDDAYGVQRTTSSNLVGNAQYYTFIPGEYCTLPNLRTCTTASASSPTYPYPAILRWCNDAALTDCRAVRIDSGTKTYTNARYPGQTFPATTTITFSSPNNAVVSGITVNSVQIMALPTLSSSNATTVASRVAAQIKMNGYTATSNNGVVTITAPASGAITATPVVTRTGVTVAAAAFSGYKAPIPGSNILTNIVATTASYPYPNTTAKATTRTDCVGTTCTYTEEMTNYANWWTYYHTRMQMMKTAASNAFAPIGNTYRIGFMTIDNGCNDGAACARTDFLNIDTFGTTQKNAWYAKLTGAKPSGSTPLRAALSKAGRLYAGSGTSINNVSVNDPVQYACQQNFALLSTDGYWNESATPTQVNGSTTIGNQDAAAIQPYYDGAQAKSITTSNTTTETYSTTGCTTGRKKIVSTVTTLTRTVITGAGGTVLSDNNPGVTTTASTGTPVACAVSPRALNPTTTTTPITAVSSSGGSSNSLADVAYYYYMTDLRTTALGNDIGALGTDVSENIVPKGRGAANDPTINSVWQHMSTFTLGLGASGYMLPSTTYLTDTSGDYFDVTNGTAANGADICPWQASGACNWPLPVNNTQTTIDDLWHAAVNGHGTYFSAGNPGALYVGLSNALASLNVVTSASAAATTSSLNPVAGNNFEYTSSFTSGDWTGDIVAQEINLASGDASTVINWSARDLLDAKTYTSRKIYTYDPTSSYDPTNTGNHLKDFNWGNLTTDERAFFNKPNISTLSQFCATGTICLAANDQTAASGVNLVNFIRGERANEGDPTTISKYYRQRLHVLGDIVSSEAIYIKAPQHSYVDAGYAGYKTTQADRQGMVYVGANDGMLHAFNADTGDEVWAYIPSMVQSGLFKLADKNYSARHQYFVDGTPTQADVFFGGAWHTILVGGLNSGGQGYYALDVTNPANPKALWEFTSDTSKTTGYVTDANLGYTFGKPEIAKLANGNWVVFVTSGYNNNVTGDGNGHLYVLDAQTGAKITAIPNGIATGTVGSVTTPSGLGQIRAWVDDSPHNNTALRVYGGDMLGNVWRFDVNNNIGAADYDAQLLATLAGPSPGNNVQPITAKPELGAVGNNSIVYIPTGRYLGLTDLIDTNVQSFYAIKDQLGVTGYGNPRADSNFIAQTISVCPDDSTDPACPAKNRKATRNTVNFATNHGWYFDLPGNGERGNTDPTLALGTLAVVTNTPNANACTAGGFSFEYFLDYRNGAAVSTANGIVGVFLGNYLSTRAVLLKLPNNSVIGVTRGSNNSTDSTPVPIGSDPAATRRVSWRELVGE